MKRVLPLLCIALLLLSACAVSSSPLPTDGFLYYYPAETVSFGENGALCVGRAASDVSALSAEDLVRDYLRSPTPNGALPVLPSDWSLLSVRQEDFTAHLTFIGKVTDSLSQSLAFACISKTLLQHPEIQRVAISYPGSSETAVLTDGDIILTDTGMLPQEEKVTLYHPDENLRYLVRDAVSVDASEAADKPRCIVQHLLSAAEDGSESSCIPKGTRLLSIGVENGICTVNLSSEFSAALEQSFRAERMAVYSIVNSLTELPEVETVDFLIAGAPIDTLYLMNLSSGLVRDESMIAAASGSGMTDVTLYPICDSHGLLAAVPMMIEITDEQELAQTVVNALLSYEAKNGMSYCIPTGTRLLSVRMEGYTCILDLTAEFSDGCEDARQELLAVRSIVATMTDLPGISFVEILVEGREPLYRSDALSAIQRPNAGWFAK